MHVEGIKANFTGPKDAGVELLRRSDVAAWLWDGWSEWANPADIPKQSELSW